MVRRNGAEAKRERLHSIARFIQRALYAQGEVSLSGMVTQIQYDYGLTESKALEYLLLLAKLGQFVLVEKEDKIRKPDWSEASGGQE